jgi:hypothetical protein
MTKETQSKKNLDFPIRDLEGGVYRGIESCSKFIAERIASTDSKQDFFKIFNISKELYEKGELSNPEDEAKLLDEIKKLRLPVIVKGQILETLNS